MTQNETIKKALNILNYRDWTWEMADDNYRGRYNAAKAEMRDFVATVNEIADAEVREALRRYWVLEYNRLQASYANSEFNDNAELENLKHRFAFAA